MRKSKQLHRSTQEGHAEIARRRLLLSAPLAAGGFVLARAASTQTPTAPYEGFPAQQRERVYDVVLHAHTDLDKLKALVDTSPALANATMDWGFGDWETAIGAASHMGRRDIADYLLLKGARPDLYTHAMLGHLEVVKRTLAAMPAAAATPGPHGITLLAHAKAGGDEAQPVVEFLEKVGNADPAQTNTPLALPGESYTGSYRWQDDSGAFEILERSGALAFKEADDFPKRLFHLGEHEFHPSGARFVRFHFDVEGQQVRGLTIRDADLELAARKL